MPSRLIRNIQKKNRQGTKENILKLTQSISINIMKIKQTETSLQKFLL